MHPNQAALIGPPFIPPSLISSFLAVNLCCSFSFSFLLPCFLSSFLWSSLHLIHPPSFPTLLLYFCSHFSSLFTFSTSPSWCSLCSSHPSFSSFLSSHTHYPSISLISLLSKVPSHLTPLSLFFLHPYSSLPHLCLLSSFLLFPPSICSLFSCLSSTLPSVVLLLPFLLFLYFNFILLYFDLPLLVLLWFDSFLPFPIVISFSFSSSFIP